MYEPRSKAQRLCPSCQPSLIAEFYDRLQKISRRNKKEEEDETNI